MTHDPVAHPGTPVPGRPAPAPVTAQTLRALRGVRRRTLPRLLVVTGTLTALLLALSCLALSTGDFTVPLGQVLRALAGRGDAAPEFIVQHVRLPRVATALAAGAAFGMSGAVFQSLVRNPLASPDVIGITSGASTGAVLAIVVLHLGGASVSLAAVLGAVLTAVAMYALAWRRGVSGYRLVLVGIGISAVLGSVVSYLTTRAEVHTAREALLWLTGSLGGADWDRARPLLLCLLPLIPLTVALTARVLPALALGDDAAAGLGLRVEAGRLWLVLAAVCLAAVATAATGPVTFVAFLAGPLARRLTGRGGPGLGGAALCGASLLLGCDLLAQHLPGVGGYPVGVVTGAVGAPCLLWLLARAGRVGQGG
ncbi:FecCD family ABC transporter permease [Streptomyces sp. SPB074]|uniref:FecCD family ABC transporter permease n=1 Tax=Streptomyces sp. (strain SPB074) TaxID=465543 RepID=UPI00017F1948|nr:iron chelate uptake ABC transporter family permease subunit [Streptomyces sp. SPB074]EDY43359.1 ferric enterobactin transport system, permease component [Streptomyces sp. SPB074]